MKTTKRRMFATLAAMAVLAGFSTVPMAGMPAAAADTTNIIIQNGSNTTYAASFSAYQILSATDGGNGKFAYGVNEKYRSVLQTAVGNAAATDAEIISYIQGLNDDTIEAFAVAVYDAIKADGSITADQTTENGSISGAAQGYYLLVNTANSDDAAFSTIIVDTAGNDELKVNIKTAAATLEKKVLDQNDSTSDAGTWEDTADYDFNDDVSFRLTATLPSNYESFKEYKLVFQDTLAAGLDKAENFAVKLIDVGTSTETVISSYSVSDPTTDGFTLTIDDLKTIAAAAGNGDQVVVTYSAKLLDSATVGGAGNKNTATLKYSQDPYYTGADDPLVATVADEVSVFTYQVIITKKDGTDNNNLEGASFKLEKKMSDDSWSEVTAGVTAAGAVFTFQGLDEGTYKLTETVVPNGYNGIEPIEFTVTAGTAFDGSAFKVTALAGTPAVADAISFTANLNDGSLSADVINKSGSELPSTGGIGTTIFYVVGGAMVLGAGIFLIAKNRMKHKDDE